MAEPDRGLPVPPAGGGRGGVSVAAETDDWWEALDAPIPPGAGAGEEPVRRPPPVGTPQRPAGPRRPRPAANGTAVPARGATRSPGPPAAGTSARGPEPAGGHRAPAGEAGSEAGPPSRRAKRRQKALAKRQRRVAALAAKGKLPRARRRPRWRGRVLPKSVIGISMVILAAGMGAAASGVALYMYYQYRLETSDALIKSFNNRYDRAVKNLDAEATNARAQIQAELEPLRKIAATGETLTVLLNQVQPSVWAVRTFDVAGQPVIGSAFAVASDSEKSFFVTSYSVVSAATAQPGPKVMLRKGDVEIEATLWTWHEERDIALLIVSQGKIPRLEWARPDANRLGDRVFAVSGLGAAGAAITQGFLADVSATAVQHDAPVGTSFQGGPLIDSDGKVVAVASRAFAPLGFPSEGVYFAPPIRVACEKVLSCPNGTVSGAGAQR